MSLALDAIYANEAAATVKTNTPALDPARTPGTQVAADPRHARWGARTVIRASSHEAPGSKRHLVVAMLTVTMVGGLGFGARVIWEEATPPAFADTSVSVNEDVPFQVPVFVDIEPPEATASPELPAEPPMHVAVSGEAIQRETMPAQAPAFTIERRGKPHTGHAKMIELAAAAERGRHERAHAVYRELMDDPAAEKSMRPAELAWLHFLEGNLYAREARWAEAENAFRAAFVLESSGRGATRRADYAFNLAVALERLGRPAEALTHYRAALAAADAGPVAFDHPVAAHRIAALSSAPVETFQ